MAVLLWCLSLYGLYQFSQCQQGMEGDAGEGCGGGGGGGDGGRLALGRLCHRDGPRLGDADASYLGVVNEVAGWLAVGRFENAFDDGRLPCQRVIWMYNPHNLLIFYRYRGFI
ncbi:MAG TPA: hypothetical protein PLD25_29970 [Chloroflexota bacterium]|nr:hypothetical protein [Chloroflexota bacterium]HUM67359.1 hypothetical protein [Chloroflexota bacterium]